MKCYKCGGEIALIRYWTVFYYRCLPCIYDTSKLEGKHYLPLTKSSLEKIRNGKKWTSLRSLKYDNYPFEKERIYLTNIGWSFPNNPTRSTMLIPSEGFNWWIELITALKKKGFKLPQEFYLYDLRKPIK